jgi:predicted Ser/Thr protein kinase
VILLHWFFITNERRIKMNVYEGFIKEKILYNDVSALVVLGKDKTCIKQTDGTQYNNRLRQEAVCLEMVKGLGIAPELVGYDEEKNALRMEYIDGLVLKEYVKEYGKIPTYYMSELVNNLLVLIDHGVEYGSDIKYNEHFIIQDDRKKVRIIDFGISDIISGPAAEYMKAQIREEYSFVFKENKGDIESIDNWKERMLHFAGIPESVIETYLDNMVYL